MKQILNRMQNNLVFAKMLGVFGINRNDEQVAELLKSQGIQATKTKVRAWRSSPSNVAFREMPDFVLEAFFEALKMYGGDFTKLKNVCNSTPHA